VSTYQDVVNAWGPIGAWALTESAGTDFVPYTGPYHLTGSGTLLYRQAGPFAASLAVHLATNARMLTNGLLLPGGQNTLECWVHLDANPPAAFTPLMFWGNSAANGNGLVWDTDGFVKYYVPTVATTSTGFNPGAGWHLFQLGNVPGVGGSVVIAVDGVIRYQKVQSTGLAGSPDQIGFGCTPVANSAVGLSIAFPAVYNIGLSPLMAQSIFEAASTPNDAILKTPAGNTANNALLNQIYAAVHRTFPTT